MDETLKRQILARLYGLKIGAVTVLSRARVIETGIGPCWRAPGLEYWPTEDELVVRLEDIQPLIGAKEVAVNCTQLIPTAAGREAWKRMGCPMPGEPA